MTPTEYRKSPEHREVFSGSMFMPVLDDEDRTLPVTEHLTPDTYQPIPQEEK